MKQKQRSNKRSKKKSRHGAQIVPGLWLDKAAPDERAFVDNYSPREIASMAKSLFTKKIPDKNIEKLVGILNSWKNPRAAFNATNNLFSIVQDRDHGVNIEAMFDALERFDKAVQKNGFGQVRYFPNFVRQLRQLKKEFAFDLRLYTGSVAPYNLKIVKTGDEIREYQPTLRRGNPTSILRDMGISELVSMLQKDLHLTSRSEAVEKSSELLQLIKCALSDVRIREISDDTPSTVVVAPPAIETVHALTSQKISEVSPKKN